MNVDGTLNPPNEQVRLLCDGTLGALCRWLRVSGYDTQFFAPLKRETRDAPAQAAALQDTARRDGRLVLTRSKRIFDLLGNVAHLVRDDVVYHQVLEVAVALDLHLTRHALSRCREDNGRLVKALQSQVMGRVPPYVAATQQSFVECPECGRVYWGATHRDSMLERLAEMERVRCSMRSAITANAG